MAPASAQATSGEQAASLAHAEEIHGMNLTSPIPNSMRESFTLKADAGTDLWRAPPSTDRSNAPFVYKRVKLSTFRRAQITATARWRALYDQGGLMLMIPYPPAVPGANESERGERPSIWIKSGIEMDGSGRFASVVTTNPYSDWSLATLNDASHPNAEHDTSRSSVTVQFERTPADDTVAPLSMWVYRLLDNGDRQTLRQIVWVYDQPENVDAYIGAFAAQPTGLDNKEPLEVEFSDFQVETD